MWAAIIVIGIAILYGARLCEKEGVGYIKGILAGVLITLAVYTPISQEPVIKVDPKLIKQWQAGDDNVPETYQLWLVDGEKHMVVLPR